MTDDELLELYEALSEENKVLFCAMLDELLSAQLNEAKGKGAA